MGVREGALSPARLADLRADVWRELAVTSRGLASGVLRRRLAIIRLARRRRAASTHRHGLDGSSVRRCRPQAVDRLDELVQTTRVRWRSLLSLQRGGALDDSRDLAAHGVTLNREVAS